MDRMGHLSVLRLVLPMAVLAASVSFVQAGSTQAAAPAPVRAVVAPVVVRSAPIIQAPRQGGTSPANNVRGVRANVPAPNAAPMFSPTFQTGGQTTPMTSGTPPQQAGRFTFVPIPNSNSPTNSSSSNSQTLPAQNSAPSPARITFSAQPT